MFLIFWRPKEVKLRNQYAFLEHARSKTEFLVNVKAGPEPKKNISDLETLEFCIEFVSRIRIGKILTKMD
jgi:hypothetical protein